MRKATLLILGGIALLALVSVQLYFTPAVQWRVAALRTDIFYLLNPPDQAALAPERMIAGAVEDTLAALAQTQTPSPTPSATIAPQHTPTPLPYTPTPLPATPTPTVTPTPTPTPLPPVVRLSGIRHEWQSFNNCGPANLAMALTFWGWPGDQRVPKAVLRPNPEDPNVMPAEMAAYVEAHTELRALVRTGGTIELLRQLVAAGFPPIIEIGHHPADDWWMGHFVVVSGYDDTRGVLITQDSLIIPDLPRPYTELTERWWRDFNYLYLVIYPPEREAELLAILGYDADAMENARRTLAASEAEIPHLSGRDLFFALFNRGDSLLALGRVQEAAQAFDTAFAVYDTLPGEQRPWRILWYRQEAFRAYYEAGLYQSTIDLTSAALATVRRGRLEESYYWRGRAHAALGNREAALRDLNLAVSLRHGFTEAEEALRKLQGGQ